MSYGILNVELAQSIRVLLNMFTVEDILKPAVSINHLLNRIVMLEKNIQLL